MSLNAIDLFAGCGGLSRGFMDAGFNIIVGVDNDQAALNTFELNHNGAVHLPEQIKVSAGTIHGFQGDECDIVLVVLNTPQKISTSPNCFLNKRNIINVAISRAKDYLFVIMPNDNTEGMDKLRLVKKVEALCRTQTDACQCYTTEEIEEIIFNRPDYLELNSFSTGHQSVNVYGLPEMKYEIRSEESAIDVQIHDNFERTEDGNNMTINETNHVEESPDLNEDKYEDNTEFCYQLPDKTIKQCPFDRAALIIKDVPLWRSKKAIYSAFPLRVCPQCGKKYYLSTQIQALISGDFQIRKEEFPENIQKALQKQSDINTRQAPKKKKYKNRSNKPIQYVYMFDKIKEGLSESERCKWPGCKDRIFRNELCWEHFQHEIDEI